MDIISTGRQKNVNFDGNELFPQSWLKIRGGSEAGYFPEVVEADATDESASVSMSTITVLESTTDFDDTPELSNNESDDGEIERMDEIDDMNMIYSAIGILNIPTSNGENNILLSYNCDDDPGREIHERWGLNGETHSNLALAETYGSLCHGIVLNLPQQMFDPSSADRSSQQDVDDMLLGVAEGILRRLKGTQQLTVPLSITFEGSEAVSDLAKENAKNYVQGYLERALHYLWKLHFGKTLGQEQTNDESAIIQQCKVAVSFSASSAFEAATDLADGMIEEGAQYGETIKQNIIPPQLFGTLCNHVYTEICNGRSSQIGHRNENAVEWKKLAEETTTNDVAVETETIAVEMDTADDTAEVDEAETLKQEMNSEEKTTTDIAVEIETVDDTVEVDAAETLKQEMKPEETITTDITAEEEGSEKKIEVDATETLQQHEAPISNGLRQRVESVMAMALVDAEDSLLELENKMEEAFLDGIADENMGNHPVPEFGGDIDAILNAMTASFLAVVDEYESLTEPEMEWLEIQRIEALKQTIGRGVHRLFSDHLQNLRDHFGHWYERTLENPLADDLDTEENQQRDKNTWKLQSQKSARQADEGFMKAAVGSIPQICQHPEGELCDELAGMFGIVEALKGLLEDMYEVTSARGFEEEEWDDIMGANAEDANDIDLHVPSKSRIGLRQLIKNVKAKIQKRGPAKWYERWAFKFLIIGVNYVNGWILLQALRREATKRDQDMPKFPLF